MKYLSISFLFTFLTLQSPVGVEEIISKTDLRPQPEYISAQMTLLYKDNNGKILDKRTLKYWRSWQSVNSEVVLLKFTSPEEVKNTAFFTITNEGETSQMMFLPGLNKLISMKKKKMRSPFMNSDFNISDLKSWELTKNKNTLLHSTKEHYFIESIYTGVFYNQKMILKIDKTSFFIDEVKFYDKDCEHPSRIMKILDKKYDSEICFLTHVEMNSFNDCSEIIASSSEIIFDNFDMSTEIDPKIFTEEYMTYKEF